MDPSLTPQGGTQIEENSLINLSILSPSNDIQKLSMNF